MQSEMTDPIVYREETAPQNEELNSQEELSNQETVSSPSAELATLQPEAQTFIVITDNEVVDLKSNLLLPSGLRAYNTGDTTYVEYTNAILTPSPELSEEQMVIVHK